MSSGRVKKLFNILRGKAPVGMKPIGDEYYITAKLKCINKLNNIQTLILGSSHIETSYIARDTEFNLATSSQDLYLTYELYKKYNTPELKNIIVSYSNFSPWAHLIKSSSANYMIYFNTYANIKFEDENEAKRKKLFWKKFINRRYLARAYRKIDIAPSYCGNYILYPEGYAEMTQELKERIKNAENRKRDCVEQYLIPLLNATAANHQNIYFVLTPHRDEFKKILVPKEELFRELLELEKCYEHVHVIDLYDSTDFQKSDFYDYQHLNFSGAQKLTSIVRKEVYGENNG